MFFFLALNNQILRQFFPEFHQIRFRTLTFCICKFEVNRDHTTGCTKCLSNLTLKCYANIFVKVDAQIFEGCRRAISYLKTGILTQSFSARK